MTYLLYVTALVPFVLMALSAKYLKLNSEHQTLLESFTAGLLVASGALLLGSVQKTKNSKIRGIVGFVVSLLLIKLIDSHTSSSGLLPSLYFDSLSDGLLLGSLASTVKNINKALTNVIPITLEMMITASSAVSILNSRNVANSSDKVMGAAGVLGVAILIGHYVSRFIKDEYIIGFGSASMLWLGLKEFMPKLVNDINTKHNTTENNILLFLGVLSSMFLE